MSVELEALYQPSLILALQNGLITFSEFNNFIALLARFIDYGRFSWLKDCFLACAFCL
jgi:hypothetical protein